MIHMIGAILILCCSVSIGISNLVDRQRRINCLRQICAALDTLRGELGEKCQPLPDAFRQLRSCCGKETLRFISFIADGFSLLGERSFYEIWQEGVLSCLPQLSREEKNELIPLGSVLGRYELSQQSAALSYSASSLREEWKRQKMLLQKERKLCLGIPMALGILLILLLL